MVTPLITICNEISSLQINPLTLHDCAACKQRIFFQHHELADIE
jgi:hypothetical protein